MKLQSLMNKANEQIVKCPECGDEFGKGGIQKIGLRKNKREELQKYFCKKCRRHFVMKKMLNKSYPVNVILNSISFYNQGMTLAEASKKINARFGVKTYPRLISSWMNEFSDICTFKKFRDKIKEKEKPGKSGFTNPVFEKLIEHKQPYLYKCHRLKSNMFLNDYFSGLKDYLFDVVEICPHELFLQDNLRSSQIKINYGNINDIWVEKRYNYACKLAGLALKMARTNKARHQIIQDFMLSNDTSTLAVEVPIWLSKEEVKEINSEFNVFNINGEDIDKEYTDIDKKDTEKYDDGNKIDGGMNRADEIRREINENNINGIMSRANGTINKVDGTISSNNININNRENNNNNNNNNNNINVNSRGEDYSDISGEDNYGDITGHIDFVQARYGIIYVLDYKPGAERVDAVSQLFTYALALSVRTNIWLRNFKCAWFDEKAYYEFNPNDIILACISEKFGDDKIPEEYLKKYVLNEGAKHHYTSEEFHERYVNEKYVNVKLSRKSGKKIKEKIGGGNVEKTEGKKKSPEEKSFGNSVMIRNEEGVVIRKDNNFSGKNNENVEGDENKNNEKNNGGNDSLDNLDNLEDIENFKNMTNFSRIKNHGFCMKKSSGNKGKIRGKIGKIKEKNEGKKWRN